MGITPQMTVAMPSPATFPWAATPLWSFPRRIPIGPESWDSGRITQSSIASEIPFGYEDSAFVFTDYSMLADGIDYTYSVNLAEAEDMSVHINA